MKMNQYGIFCVVLAALLLALVAVLAFSGAFKTSVSNPAAPWQRGLLFALPIGAGIWTLAGLAGWLMLIRRGFFASQVVFFAENAWMGCIVGIFLIGGLWVLAVLPGPFLLWFASTRPIQPVCPNCRNWVPLGASVCAYCGAALPGGETHAAPTTLPSAAAPQPLASNQCENCRQVSAIGAIYSFAYGVFESSQFIGRKTLESTYRIAGRRDVYLCDRCVTEYGFRRSRPMGLIVSLAFAATSLLTLLIPDITSLARGQGFSFRAVQWPTVVMMLGAALFFFFWTRQLARKKPLAAGDLLAISLHKQKLKKEGYTHFYTREQMQGFHHPL